MNGAAVQKSERMVYVDCPKCGGPIPEPLPRGSLLPYTHRSKNSAKCRFWVHVDPNSDDHIFRVLEEQPRESFEETLDDIYPDHKRNVDRAVLLSKVP